MFLNNKLASSLFSAAVLFVSSNCAELDLPSSPYDSTSFLIDYGMLLNNYQYVNATKSDIQDAVHTFLIPVRQYQNASADSKNSDEDLKSHVLGLANYLHQTNPKNSTTMSTTDFEANNMNESVMEQETVSAAITQRNLLFKLIKSSKNTTTAANDYKKALKSYSTILNKLDAKEFNSLIAKKLNWKKFESRFCNLISKLLGNKKDANDNTEKVRSYLATFLRDGDSNDGEYEELIAGEKKKTTFTQMKTKTSTTSRSSMRTSTTTNAKGIRHAGVKNNSKRTKTTSTKTTSTKTTSTTTTKTNDKYKTTSATTTKKTTTKVLSVEPTTRCSCSTVKTTLNKGNDAAATANDSTALYISLLTLILTANFVLTA